MKKKFLINNKIKLNNFKKKKLAVLGKKFDKLILKISKEIDTIQNTFNILSEKYNFNFSIRDLKRFKKYNNIVIVGMGGSILGVEAIYQFLKKKINKKVFFFDNLDEYKLSNFKKNYKKDKTLFLIISKSGKTIETITNLFLLKILKKRAKNLILISEKKDNIFLKLSNKYKLFHIEHKNFVGGRYSVLSEVGMVPAFLMGVNIKKIRSNLRSYLKGSKKKLLKDSTTKLSYILNEKKINNLILVNYLPQLENFLYWSQQLISESLGKKNKGFLPVISNAPKDHHSMLQLYLDGPKDKIFYIFSHEQNFGEKIFSQKLIKEIEFINNKTISKIKTAQKKALVKSLINQDIPLREFRIIKIDEEVIGEMFAYFILETAIVGKLSNLNPFDQPAVEQVKVTTAKLLN